MIHVEGIGKCYRLGGTIRHDTLRDAIMQRVRRSEGPAASADAARESFWALREVSFDVAAGEVVGVIGKNGAGKSTLLKILSRITSPSEGRIRLLGRVASLLEVGTGFHPELSGSENIYLNGAILGMKRREIRSKFDEIVDFSEVGAFLETPVKRYSSGMLVRLAFSVAAHLDPEILIVDEVLAVGDAAFQKKCLGKVGEVARGGRTVLFVSHNMVAVQQLTSRAILLAEGRLVDDAPTPRVVAVYLAEGNQASMVEGLATSDPDITIDLLAFDEKAHEPGFNRPLRFELSLALRRAVADVSVGLGIYNSLGARIVTSRVSIPSLSAGENPLSIQIHDHHLPPGDYTLAIGISRGTQMLYYAENVLRFALSDLGVDDPLIQPYLVEQRDRIGTFVPGIWEKA